MLRAHPDAAAARDADQRTPLHLAAANQAEEALRTLTPSLPLPLTEP